MRQKRIRLDDGFPVCLRDLPKRQQRRYLTQRVVGRRLKFWQSNLEPDELFHERFFLEEQNRFNRRRPFGCGCAKRMRGQPRIWRGMCTCSDRVRVLKWRTENCALRALGRQFRHGSSLDWDADGVAVLFAVHRLWS